jgi:hypothetical protein
MKLLPPPLFSFRGAPKFVTDGCSGYMTWLWDLFFDHDPPWESGCVIHDWYYWSGGQPIIPGSQAYTANFSAGATRTRRAADDFLFRYVYGRGYRVWAWLIWLGVRVGGTQWLPFSWRWRYRERYIDVLMGRVT